MANQLWLFWLQNNGFFKKPSKINGFTGDDFGKSSSRKALKVFHKASGKHYKIVSKQLQK